MNLVKLKAPIRALSEPSVREQILGIVPDADLDALVALDCLDVRGVGLVTSTDGSGETGKSLLMVYDTERYDGLFEDLKSCLKRLNLPFDEEDGGDGPSEGPAIRFFRSGMHDIDRVYIDDFGCILESLDRFEAALRVARDDASTVAEALELIVSNCTALQYKAHPLLDYA